MELYSSQEVTFKFVLNGEEMSQFIGLFTNIGKVVHQAGYTKKIKFSDDDQDIIEKILEFLPNEDEQNQAKQAHEVPGPEGNFDGETGGYVDGGLSRPKKPSK